MTQGVHTPATARYLAGPRLRMTYQQFLDWEPEGEPPHVEWVDGEVVAMAPAPDEHMDIVGFLAPLLRAYAEARDGGIVRTEPFQMKTGPKLPGRAPDVLFLSKKNLSRRKKTHVAGPADLVVEVISPGSRGVDRGDKFFEYESGGVKEYWLIDPERQQAEFYQLGRNGIFKLMPLENGVFRSAVLEGLWIRVDWLWQRPMPPLVKVLRQWKLA